MDQSELRKLIAIVGPTAVGKTDLAIDLAVVLGTEVVSADSRQFFRELVIGTAKPSATQLSTVRHHFVNHLSIFDEYDAAKFEAEALKVLEGIFVKSSNAVLVGGSGLYVDAVVRGLSEIPQVPVGLREELNQEVATHGLSGLLEELRGADPACYESIDRQNHSRVIRAIGVIRTSGKPYSSFLGGSKRFDRPFSTIKIGLSMDRAELYARIDARMDEMLEAGLVEEARSLRPHADLNALQTVGYAEIFPYLDGTYDHQEAVRLLKRNSRRYAKRQLTWFRKDPEITWFEPGQRKAIHEFVKTRLDTKNFD